MARNLLFTLVVFTTLFQLAQAQVPSASFTANVTAGCAPLTVQFTDQSTGSPVYWNWDFGNGALSNVQNPVVTFSTPGTYSVTLIVRNADGTNGITKTNYITVNASPQAFIDLNNFQYVGCVPATYHFKDKSVPVSGTLVKWEWDFGDGTTSTEQNPVHEYKTVGYYPVLLKVTSSTGCFSYTSIGRPIRIVSGIIPDFSASNPTTCRGPFNVNFSNLTSGPGTMTYNWNFGNGNSSTDESPTAIYAAGGNYTVTLNATSEFGCTGSIQKQVAVSGTGTNFTGPDTICLNTTATFQNASSSTPVNTNWDFGNGETANTINGTSTYNTAGIFKVKMTNEYPNCTDSFSKQLVVIDKPVVNFTAPVTTGCKAPLTVNFQDASPGAVDWQWDFGDGTTGNGANPSHTYTVEGQFDVKLTITTRQGCTNSLTQPAFVRIIAPTVAFSNAPAGGCVGYHFTPSVNVNSLFPVTGYLWEYGEGAPENSVTPVGHTYNTIGQYNIKVTITTSNGCTAYSELISGIKIGTKPIADFTLTPTDACASDTIRFSYIQSAPAANSWLWDFDDGSSSDEENPKHLYADSGTKTVTLIAYNNLCPSTAVSKTVHIKSPIAKFSSVVNCNTGMVDFTNESKVDPSEPVTYTWDFGDGSPVSMAANPPSHSFPGKGTYTISLTVASANAGGCSHVFTHQIEIVTESADFKVTPVPACQNAAVFISAINSDPGNITKYEWSINSGPFITQGRDYATTLAPGNYTIDLRITDINGCTDTKRNSFTVYGPTAKFVPAQPGGCANGIITFTDQSTSSGNIQKWSMDFGDGQSEAFTSATAIKHTYATPGSYIVKMTITDDKGCQDTYTSNDTVFITKPVAGFKGTYTTICPKTDLPFKDTSSGKNLSWFWDFGDGQNSTDQSPIHQYTATSGSYTVKLVITDDVGCKDSVFKADYITVQKPVPGFTARDTSSICELLETKFTLQSTGYDYFYYDFGDGALSTLPNPNHFYNTYGSYVAKLYVVGYGGCVDSASDTINVYDPSAFTDIQYSPLSACNSLMVDFDVITPPATKFIFYYADGGLDSSQTKVFQHFYKDPGQYRPSLLLEDNVGCKVSVAGLQSIDVLGAAPYFNPSKKAFCDSGTVYFTNYTYPPREPIATRVWNFGDGTTSNAFEPVHDYKRPGTYLVSQTVTTVLNSCTNTITDTIRVYATPDPLIVSDTATCINRVLDLQASLTVPDTAVTWKWDLGSLGQSDKPVVSVKYPQTGTYTIGLEAANKLGCKDNTSKNILVSAGPVITVNGNATIPVGTGIPLPVSYSDQAVSYSWTPTHNLSCTDCPTPVANPQFTTTYTVKATDIYGCSVAQDITVMVICNKENYYVPNTFSPNNDGQNDVFMPRGKSIARVNRLQIFNRWGELVFERRNFMVNDAAAGWNGTYKGKPAAADVYVYVIEFVCDNASVVPFRGNVTLLR